MNHLALPMPTLTVLQTDAFRLGASPRASLRNQRGRSTTPVLGAILLAIAAGAGGWWLGQRPAAGSADATSPIATPAAAAASGAASATSAASPASSASSASAAIAGGPGPGAAARRFGGANRVQPVTVALVRKQDVKVVLNGIGNISALNTAVVRTRVEGELKSIRFKEGQMVRAGALLAEIDARSYEIALAQTQSQLAKDQATLKNAQLDLARYKDLLAKDSIARQQVDTQEALVQQLVATIQSDQAQVDNAQLQLSYTKITAPISGRLGLKQADLGNTVRASDASGLVTITQTQPISVVFAMPEANLPQIARRLRSLERTDARSAQAPSGGSVGGVAAAGAARPANVQGGKNGAKVDNKPAAKSPTSTTATAKPPEPLMVEAWDREQRNLLATGRVSTTDNVIDPVTGTIKLKAEFANADGALFPNQFVNIKLQINTLEGALAVPSAAIQRGAIGTFVYVVKPDNTVNMRRVRTGTTEGDFISVNGDLESGERVVTDGADRLREGAKVEVITPPPRFGAGGLGGSGGSGGLSGPGGPSGAPGARRESSSGNASGSAESATPRAGASATPPGRAEGARTTVQEPTPANTRPPAAASTPASTAGAGWIDQLPPEAQERVRMTLERLGPEVTAKVHKMSPDERRAFFQQLRAQRQQQE